jgi:hypothetical protein
VLVDLVEQALELERVREGELDLQAGLLGADELGEGVSDLLCVRSG